MKLIKKNNIVKIVTTTVFFLSLFYAEGCTKNFIIPDAKYNAISVGMFGEKPERNFFIQKPISDSLKLKWSVEINGGLNTSAVALQGETIFCSDLSGRIYAFNLKDGKELGYLSYKNLIIAAPIVNQLKLLYAVVEAKDNLSTIYQYDIKTGKMINEIEITGKVIKEMIRLDDGFIVFTEQGNVFRFHYNSRKIWEYKNESFIHSNAAADNDKLIFGDDNGSVTTLNIKTGELLSRVKLQAGIEGGFTIYNNHVYFGDNSGNVQSMDLSTGKITWSASIGFKTVSFPIIDGNSLFIGNVRGDLIKLNLKDGSQSWKLESKGNLNTTGLVFENLIIQPDYNKRILFVDKNDGRIVKEIYFEDKLRLSPFFFNDLIFIGTETGKLFAYEVIYN